MTENVNEALQLLSQYFVLIYPGLITYLLYKFIKASSVNENKNSIIKIIAISYIYTKIVQVLFHRNTITDLRPADHIIILGMAIMLPVLFNLIIHTNAFAKSMHLLGINTDIHDNAMDAIRYKEKDKKKGIIMKIFLDNIDVMYEGSLRLHESDASLEQYVCLSGYRRYVKQEGKYVIKNDYGSNHSQWVYIKTADVNRIEILYQDPK